MAKANLSMFPSSTQSSALITTEDRISELPESVMCHIMSFLPTKDALKTMLLSKRWRHTWTSVTSLSFYDYLHYPEGYQRRTSFVNFVNRVLILHRQPCIQRFRLILSERYSNFDVDAWIRAAITRKTEEFDIKGSIQLPRTLYRYGSIKVLKLSGGIDLDVPESICFPSLKVLHLQYIQSFCNASLEKLVSGSPVLEELLIERSYNDDFLILCVHSLSLKRLKICQCGGFVKTNFKSCRVIVDAPELEYLELINHLSFEYDIERNLSSIVEANLRDANVNGDQVVQILQQICNVKVLSLSPSMLKALLVSYHHSLPCFHNLTQLAVTSSGMIMPMILSKILRCSPNLKVLILNKNYDGVAPCGLILDEQFVPHCLKSSLERLEYRVFQDSEGEMELIEYFLKSAKVLKKITISTCSFAITNYKRSQVRKKLSSFPKGSNTCQIIISDVFSHKFY